MSLQIPDNHDRSASGRHHQDIQRMIPKQEHEVLFQRNFNRTERIKCLCGSPGYRELISNFMTT